MPRTHTFQSKSIPDASYILKTPGVAVRHRCDVAVAHQINKQRLISMEKIALVPEEGEFSIQDTPEQQAKTLLALEKRVNGLNDKDRARYAELNLQQSLFNEELKMLRTMELVVSFSELGEEYADIKTTDDLFEAGPIEFVHEILASASDLWSITSTEKKSLPLPIISTEPTAGPTTDSTATPASEDATTANADAS